MSIAKILDTIRRVGGTGVPGGPLSWSSITGKPTFSPVAYTGDYNDLANRPPSSPGGASTPTNLAVAARGATTLDVTSDTGTDATLPAATSALAGLMSAADKTKLDGLSGAAGGGAPVYRKANVVANGVTGFIVLTGFGTQAQLDAATVTPSADGATITVAALAAGFVLVSVSAHLPDGFTSASTSAFSFVLPANFGVNALDSLPIVDLVRFNAAGMRQAQTNIGVSVTGTAVTVTQTGLTGGVAARFKATAL